MSLPIPKPLYSCIHCYAEYSRPAEELHWWQGGTGQGWVCNGCWDEEHGERGPSLASVISDDIASLRSENALLQDQLSSLLDDPEYEGGIHWHNRRYNDLCTTSLNLIQTNAEAVAENARLSALVEKIREALTKCVNDIEFWSEVLDRDWNGFDGQLYPASNLAKEALSLTPDKMGEWVRREEMDKAVAETRMLVSQSDQAHHKLARENESLRAKLAEAENLLRRANPPPERAYECLAMLDAAGMGKEGAPHGNTLTGMVKEVCAKLSEAEGYLDFAYSSLNLYMDAELDLIKELRETKDKLAEVEKERDTYAGEAELYAEARHALDDARKERDSAKVRIAELEMALRFYAEIKRCKMTSDANAVAHGLKLQEDCGKVARKALAEKGAE